MKKLVKQILPSLLMMVVLLPFMAQEAQARQDWVNVDGVVGGMIQYDTDTGYIVSCETSVTSANIPMEINGVRIVGISKSAFQNCAKLESVYIPDTVLVLDSATTSSTGNFSGCTALKSVRLSENIKIIPPYAFRGCTALTASGITIPNSVMTIEKYAFQNCKSLTTLVIPDSVTTLGEYAFYGCTMLSHINMPENLTTIAGYIFKDCTLLTSIYIPESVTTISTSFPDSTLLTDVYYGGTSNQWNSINITYSSPNLTSANIHFNSEAQAFVTAYYSQWAKDFILGSAQAKIIPNSLGEDYTKTITREQICELLVQTVEKKTGKTLPTASVSTFTDTSNTAILKAYQAGIVSGTSANLFSPNLTATREQIAVMIYNSVRVIEENTGREIASKNTVLTGYNDAASVSSWALDSVAILANNGIMTGTSSNMLSPKNTTTIEQSLILALGVYNL